MKILVVLAHPVSGALCAHLAAQCVARLEAGGHEVVLRDLYAEGFDPVLSAQDHAGYGTAAHADVAGIAEMEGLVLVFPTWWSGPPAILKGWIERSFLPGVAFDPLPDGSGLRPRLSRLRAAQIVTTQGASAWIDRFVLGRPVWRALGRGVLKTCAPQARIAISALHRADQMTPDRLAAFEARLHKQLDTAFGTDR